jgi:hypothetical protein
MLFDMASNMLHGVSACKELNWGDELPAEGSRDSLSSLLWVTADCQEL